MHFSAVSAALLPDELSRPPAVKVQRQYRIMLHRLHSAL